MSKEIAIKDALPDLSFERLQKEIPAFDWAKGHSGVFLSNDIVAKLDELSL